MAKKIRVHELAKELGMTNAECLELSEGLGVAVTSHSSSMDEPQADRVRRKAEREGLIKPPIVEETAKPSTKSKESTSTTKPSKAEKTEPAKTPISKTTTTKKATTKTVVAKSKTAPVDEGKSEKAKATPKTKTDAKPSPTTDQSEVRTETKPQTSPRAKPDSSSPSMSPGQKQVAAAKNVTEGKPASATKPPPPPPTSEPERLKPGSKPSPDMPPSRSGKPIPPPPSTPSRPVPGTRATSMPPGSAKTEGPRRPPRRGNLKPGVVLPSGGKAIPPPPDQKTTKNGKGTATRPPHLYQPRRRRGGRRRRRAPIEALQPVDKETYTPSHIPVPEGTILIERGSTPQNFAQFLNRTVADVVKYFFDHGETITASTQLSDEMVELYALEIGAEVKLIDPGEELEEELSELLEIPPLDSDKLKTRGPVVTIMGHVDHGKTKLLDKIRSANVAGAEKGGITQHIGAYQVSHKGTDITFIDTPGHQAFTAMRSRGASSTDIVVLVVAADDGVMPQTVEAINHAKSADVPVLVAVNKMDLENKDVSRVLQQISEQGLIPESYGGDILVSEVSATEGSGMDDLLEKIVLLAELQELKTVTEGRAAGVVLESNVDLGRGPVATLLVKQGVLSVGDPIVAGSTWGKVRALINDKGENVKQVFPPSPVQVLGLSQAPNAGSSFACAPSESVANKVGEKRFDIERNISLRRSASVTSGGASLEDVFSEIRVGQVATLNLILKADTFGSLEAVTDCLNSISKENLKVSYVHKAVGGITESDIQLAVAAGATVIGFNIRPDKRIRDLAGDESVEIRTYEIIYDLVEDVEKALKGMLEPEYEEVVTGEAEVREVFHIKNTGFVAGCYIRSGKISSGSGVRFLRDGSIIWKGEIKSLKRFSDDTGEVQAGNECGIGLSDFQDLKQGDVIETYENVEITAGV